MGGGYRISGAGFGGVAKEKYHGGGEGFGFSVEGRRWRGCRLLTARWRGLRTTQLSINGEPVVVTSKDSGGWRELLSRRRGAIGVGVGRRRVHRVGRPRRG